jgi:hypothetical protein
MAGEVSIVAIVKGEERYVFMFDDDSRAETLRMLGRYASNPELSFSWYDAAVLSQKIRQAPASAGQELAGPHGQASPATGRNRFSLRQDDSASFPDLDFTSPDDMWIGDDPAGP